MSAFIMVRLLVILTFLRSESKINGAVVISPSPRAELCSPDQSLEVTCNITNSTDSILQWRVEFPSEISMTTDLSAIVSIGTMHDQTHVLDSIIFTFRRSSELRAQPLSSILYINPVKSVLNGSRISCIEGLDTSTGPFMNSSVFIIGNYHQPQAPVVNLVVQYFGTSYVEIMLSWENDKETSFLSHHVYVHPNDNVTIIFSPNALTAILTVSYNIRYVVNVEANICGHRNTTPDLVLYHVKCEYPLNEDEKNSTLEVTGYSEHDPALVGSIVNYTCADGKTIQGPDSSTCMNTGQWKPDPRLIECKVNCVLPTSPRSGYVLPYTSTLEGSNITYVLLDGAHISATCNKKGNWELTFSSPMCNQPSGLSKDAEIAIVSSLTICIVTSVLFFAIGFMCSSFCRNKKKSVDLHVTPPRPPSCVYPTLPLYEVILPNDVCNCNKQDLLQMKRNSAYGQVPNKLIID